MSICTSSDSSKITMVDGTQEMYDFKWCIQNFQSISASETLQNSTLSKIYFRTKSSANAQIVTGDTPEDKSIWKLYFYAKYIKEDSSGEEIGPFLSFHIDHSEMNRNVALVMGTMSILTSDYERYNTKHFSYVDNTWVLIPLEFFMVRRDLLKVLGKCCPNDTLTIICEMSIGKNYSLQKLCSVGYTHWNQLDRIQLISDLKNLLKSGQCCDVTLNCGGSEFKAHKAILLARSPVFSGMFKHDTMENQTNIVNIEDISGCAMEKFLAFVYGEDVESSLTVEICADLYIAADKYEILELKTMCAHFLSLNLSVENVCKVALLADLHEYIKLFKAAGQFVKRNVSKLISSKDWLNLGSEYHEVAVKLIS